MKAKSIKPEDLRDLRIWELAHAYRVSEKTVARWRDAGLNVYSPQEIFAHVKRQRSRPRGIRGQHWPLLIACRILEKRMEPVS
jgi:hypothetical protein